MMGKGKHGQGRPRAIAALGSGVALVALAGAGTPALAGTLTDCTDPTSGSCVELSGHSGRGYRLYVPGDLPAGRPLLVGLHGGGTNSQTMLDDQGGEEMNVLAERDKFVVLYPEGTSTGSGTFHWNDCRSDRERNAVDSATDVDFIDDLIGEALAGSSGVFNGLSLDSDRVYIFGGSNGGMMALRLATQAEDMVNPPTRIATAVANEPENPWSACSNATPDPIPVLFMNGTEDILIPYAGGCIEPDNTPLNLNDDKCNGPWVDNDSDEVLEIGDGGTIADPSTLDTWMVDINGCSSTPSEFDFDDNGDEGGAGTQGWESTVKLLTYRGCDGGSEVKLYKVTGGGHTLPGVPDSGGGSLVGDANIDIDGPNEMWDFFHVALFSDGWEGATDADDAWTASLEMGNGTLSVSSSAALADESTDGMAVDVDGTSSIAYVADGTPSSEGSYRGTFWLDPNSIAMGTSEEFYLHGGWESSDGVFLVAFVEDGSGYELYVTAHTDTNGVWTTPVSIDLTDEPHWVEVRWKRSSAGDDNGYVCLRHIASDDEQCSTGIDNDTRDLTTVGLGAITGVDANTDGTIYIDDYQSFTF